MFLVGGARAWLYIDKCMNVMRREEINERVEFLQRQKEWNPENKRPLLGSRKPET